MKDSMAWEVSCCVVRCNVNFICCNLRASVEVTTGEYGRVAGTHLGVRRRTGIAGPSAARGEGHASAGAEATGRAESGALRIARCGPKNGITYSESMPRANPNLIILVSFRD